MRAVTVTQQKDGSWEGAVAEALEDGTVFLVYRSYSGLCPVKVLRELENALGACACTPSAYAEGLCVEQRRN